MKMICNLVDVTDYQPWRRLILALAIAGSAGAFGPAHAIVTTDTNPAFPIGSIWNADNYFCQSTLVPCRVFGVGQTSTRLDGVSGTWSCTATPIGPRTILSAAHCFDGNDAGGAVDNAALAQTFFLIPGVLGPIQGTPVNYPGYSGAVVESRDIAVVILNQPLPAWVPIFRLSSFNAVPRGAVVTHVGYGVTGTGLTGVTMSSSPSPFGTVNIVLNTLDSVSSDGVRFTIDFDGASINRIGGGPVQETGPKIGQTTYYEGNPAFGDSGGPVLFNSAVDLQHRPLPVIPKLLPDEYEVIGVTSTASDVGRNGKWSDYGDTATFIFVGTYIEWIRSVSPEVGVSSSLLNHDLAPNSTDPGGVSTNDIPRIDIPTMPDADMDLIDDGVDNCVYVPNYEQENADADRNGDACDADDDNDGMPDNWELRYSFDALNAADASQDADGDGHSNVSEYTAGTSPRDANDPPKVTPSSNGGGGAMEPFYVLVAWAGAVIAGMRRRRWFTTESRIIELHFGQKKRPA